MNESYVFGILWAVATISDDMLLIRSVDESDIEPVAAFLQRKSYLNGGTCTLKLSLHHPLTVRLLSLGWSGRKDKERGLPIGDVDMAEWVAGYCRIRAHVSQGRDSKRRLRVYGSMAIIFGLSSLLYEVLGVKPKKPQQYKSYNGETWILHYQHPQEVADMEIWLATRKPPS